MSQLKSTVPKQKITAAEKQKKIKALTANLKEQAIGYATAHACFRSGEIRILDSTGKLERTIPFSEADRKL